MISRNQITGIILAGGESSRMGQDKALVLWNGKTLLDWVKSAISPLCSQVLISSNSTPGLFPDDKLIADRFRNIGPIAGIESGLSHAGTAYCLIVSCDTPLLTTTLFEYLITNHGDFDISLAAHDGVNEPMIGIYNKSIHSTVIQSIENNNYKPPAIIRQTRWQEINIHPDLNFYSPELFKNMNRPEDLDIETL
ncbi:MAG: molybdenum cofactor guanylyltransferase [Bacteroidales bacterium]|nr:molybdenum cofactor guanylyltransferase [Bacteroidales bacterium]